MMNIYSPSSRSMSSRLALTLGLLLALLLSLPSYAQDGQSKEPINRTISGFTLGVTTPAEARAIIQRQGGEIEETQAWSDEVVYAITGLKYARHPTLSVRLYFYKGHLRSISFTFGDLKIFEQIESGLENKYGTMAEGKATSKMRVKGIADAFTSLEVVVHSFEYDGHVGFAYAYISYTDLELERAYSAENENEI